MLNQKELNSVVNGEKINHYLILTKLEIKSTSKNKPFLNLEFRDKSAIIPGKMWEKFEDIVSTIKDGDLVFVEGTMGEFNGPQITAERIRTLTEKDKVSIEDFLPKSVRPLKEMIDEFNQVISSVSNKFLNQLLLKIFRGEKLNSYFKAPAGKSWHHAYLYGLLEHTLEIVKLCDLMCSLHSEINRDLLITGALLHDIGKTEELYFENTFDYTDKGKLVGHIVLGAIEVEKAADSIEVFPQVLKDHVVHLVLSHQGKLEFASPVEPKTLEAIVLYQADELSAKTNAYKYAIESEKNKGSSWTKFLPLANTSLYIPNNNEQNEK